jgi:hypothetical protein
LIGGSTSDEFVKNVSRLVSPSFFAVAAVDFFHCLIAASFAANDDNDHEANRRLSDFDSRVGCVRKEQTADFEGSVPVAASGIVRDVATIASVL